MALQQDETLEKSALVIGDDHLIVPYWIHAEVNHDIKITHEALLCDDFKFTYKGKYSLPIPGVDIEPAEVYQSLSDYDNALLVESDGDGHGLQISVLSFLNGTVNEEEGMLCTVSDDGDPGIWLDPKRPSVSPDGHTSVCVFSSTNDTPKYLLRQDGPLESEFNESFDSAVWMADKLNVAFHTVTSALNSAYERAKTK